MKDYEVKIAYANRELAGKERIKIKDTSNAVKLDELLPNEDGSGYGAEMIVDTYAVLDVHNEKAENTDYSQYVFLTEDGEKYVTSSDTFYRSFKDIAEELEAEGEPLSIIIYKKESKNFKGKYFLTCSVN